MTLKMKKINPVKPGKTQQKGKIPITTKDTK